MSGESDRALESAISASHTETLPGAPAFPEPLQRRLEEALAAKGAQYEPRTELLLGNGRPRFTNRLILEDSPYLIQHAHNPVNWYPWGPEAFAEAERLQKPIFLSIGYSTCHWCHVMERESFDNVEMARLMNEMFVCIKVDRERRPDVDDIYMTAVQMTTGHGGWPMSSFLTPEGKPFFGGTYFPPDRFRALLQQVNEAWSHQREALLRDAERVAAAVTQATAARGAAEEVGQDAIYQGVSQILARHDRQLGGFGGAPKFPHEADLLLLLTAALRHGNPEALAVAEKTLTAMARGGIYDQIGGGFARYSTDAHWLVPHFEKMLYNQAHLARAYLEAWQMTGKPLYARVARQTLDYVLRDMRSPEGAFYSATDADSEGREGAFFVWTPEQLRQALDPEDAELAIDLFGLTDQGNFEGKNILYLPRSLEELAVEKELPLPDLLLRVERIREQLRTARERRLHPLRDEKILTAWNAMMITALAQGAEILNEPRYLDAARTAAERLWAVSRRGQGELWRVHLDGSSSIAAVQEDYAYFAEALVSLYDVTAESVWLQRAVEITDGMLARFWDEEAGGFFMSDQKADPNLIARPKSPTDGAIPSGNSVAVRSLVMLATRTGEALYRDRANATLAAFSSVLRRHPSAFSYMLLATDEMLHGPAGPRQYNATGKVRAQARLSTEDGGDWRLEVHLWIADGWHINAHEPLQEELVATELLLADDGSGWQLRDPQYPEPERVRLSFQQDELAVYQGNVQLRASLIQGAESSAEGFKALAVLVRIQACSDETCLRPEALRLEISTAPL